MFDPRIADALERIALALEATNTSDARHLLKPGEFVVPMECAPTLEGTLSVRTGIPLRVTPTYRGSSCRTPFEVQYSDLTVRTFTGIIIEAQVQSPFFVGQQAGSSLDLILGLGSSPGFLPAGARNLFRAVGDYKYHLSRLIRFPEPVTLALRAGEPFSLSGYLEYGESLVQYEGLLDISLVARV